MPWAYAYSTWYHQYPRFPQQALQAAGLLSEYTLTDKGTYLSSNKTVQQSVKIFINGSDSASDPLLNPARLLLGAKATPGNSQLARKFLEWMCEKNGGQAVVRNFKINEETLYSEAPACDWQNA